MSLRFYCHFDFCYFMSIYLFQSSPLIICGWSWSVIHKLQVSLVSVCISLLSLGNQPERNKVHTTIKPFRASKRRGTIYNISFNRAKSSVCKPWRGEGCWLFSCVTLQVGYWVSKRFDFSWIVKPDAISSQWHFYIVLLDWRNVAKCCLHCPPAESRMLWPSPRSPSAVPATVKFWTGVSACVYLKESYCNP